MRQSTIGRNQRREKSRSNRGAREKTLNGTTTLWSLSVLLVHFAIVFSDSEAFRTCGNLGRTRHQRSSTNRNIVGRSVMDLATTTSLSCTTSTGRITETTTTTTSISLGDYVNHQIELGHLDANLGNVLLGVAQSCALVSTLLQKHTLDFSSSNNSNSVVTTAVNVQGEQQQKMDVVANDVFLETLGSIDSVVAMASEEEESVVYTNTSTGSDNHNGGYEIAFDPLDGSGNLDANLPTGSIFGIAPAVQASEAFSRPGTSLVAAGYALYSSSTELIISLGSDHPDGVLGFTLVVQPPNGQPTFVLSRSNIQCPSHGPYYSLNEAREPDWPEALREWIRDAKRGQTTTQQKYSSRYVCSLCADFHRTLLQGGWAGNPRPHLRLLYEAAPLAFVARGAGAKGVDGKDKDLLEIVPKSLHDRVCVFLGSTEDIDDLQSYGDVRQVRAKRYDA